MQIMKNTNYSDKLKNPIWQKKRLEILQLRGFKCELCSCETKELHVHHRFYIKGRNVWEYDNDVFQVLCCDCHEKEHKKKEIAAKNLALSKYQNLINIIESSDEKYALDNIEYFVETLVNSNNIESMSFAFNDSMVFEIIIKTARYCQLTEQYAIKTSIELESLKNIKNGKG